MSINNIYSMKTKSELQLQLHEISHKIFNLKSERDTIVSQLMNHPNITLSEKLQLVLKQGDVTTLQPDFKSKLILNHLKEYYIAGEYVDSEQLLQEILNENIIENYDDWVYALNLFSNSFDHTDDTTDYTEEDHEDVVDDFNKITKEEFVEAVEEIVSLGIREFQI